ncbi:hypothetical protein CAPTEDRAFT_225982 [Capitella teleta]|uniref:Transcription initiation factor TFIID subunit 1 n=1 Tax=Capitella teleta TaxID=283909 RepID=R7UK52_CAPTE|nr:hypothetical protein CAPTEDRAFT_225982 [Capitella teleta]|eukprot:ELU04183.1 hypothetical protein CAPTEDRAFT_225982 [Capitella teleta]
MDSDHEDDHEMDNEEDAAPSARNTTLTGFLFGNIDKHGQLEEDLLDEDSKRQLGELSSLGMGSMVNEITEENNSNGSDEDLNEGMSVKNLDSAVDYSDINEMAVDEEEARYKAAMAEMEAPTIGGEDYDGCDSRLMPPPTWIPSQPPRTPTGPLSPGVFSPKDCKIHTPLSGMLPPELKDKDVREWFPEFRAGQVLRFSRLFKPVYMPHIYKRKRKKKEDEGKEEEILETNEDDDDQYEDCPFKLDFGRPAKPEEMMTDEAITILQADGGDSADDGSTAGGDRKPRVADWRYGPAQLWYDMLGVDESGEGFDYGFACKEGVDEDEEMPEGYKVPPLENVDIPPEAYHMICQVPWEEEVIWNGEDVRTKVLANQKQAGARAGWIPSSNFRTAHQYFLNVLGKTPPVTPSSATSAPKAIIPRLPSSKTADEEDGSGKPDKWFSIFPVENEDLIYGRWEDDIIWDNSDVDSIPNPNILTLDPNDENIILEIPEDRNPDSTDDTQAATTAKKEKEIRKSRQLLNKAGIIKEEEEEVEEEEETLQLKDPFNLSNDEYYNPKLTTDSALGRNMGASLIQHSTPAAELRQPFFPTHLGPMKLRTFHRPPLKKYSHGPMASFNHPHPTRDSERMASGGGDMFFMRTSEDLTGKDGDIILIEYSEEYPPLINQVGMASKIKIFYKRKPGKDNHPPQYDLGELVYAHTSPFLGTLVPGQALPSIENNMYRAPIYCHDVPESDFLIIRTRQHFYIREVAKIYTVGQCCPLMEVPGPNSKKANNFLRDFLQVFIYRLFWKSKDNPRRIKMEEIKKAFPSHSESSIRKRLKLCADFKRTGIDSNWWVLKPDYRLPEEEEMRAMVSPEQCCAFYSMLAAEQRLKDAGYGEKSLFAQEEDNEEESAMKMEDEVRTAPWNTTRAYISAMKGRCLLSLTGIADPTGCGEGFSYVKVPNKPQQQKDDNSASTPAKKTVTGTDADLRRLSLKDAKQLLKKFGVPEGEIKKLSRWEVIDVVRTMSTEQAKAGQEGEGMSKFARGNRFSTAEHQERYKEECQRIFDLQNRVLSSKEVLSTDEESSEADDSDFEEMGKNLENMLSNKKTSSQLNMEREEQERLELQKMLRGEDIGNKEKDRKMKKKEEEAAAAIPNGVKKLKITRTFINEDGGEFTRTEIVRKPSVIDIYVKIRQTKDQNFIRQFATLDDHQKEEMKKERRRLQEQLRRIKRVQEKGNTSTGAFSSAMFEDSFDGDRSSSFMDTSSTSKKKKAKKEVKKALNLKLKCGACGQVGHMRTNKECPLYNKGGTPEVVSTPPAAKNALGNIAVTEQEEEQLEKSNLVDQELINVEGTKVKISKTLVEHVGQVKRKSLVLKFPKNMTDSGKKRRRAGTISHCDYLKKPRKLTNRRRADPLITISSIFENILNEMREVPNAQPFLVPVNPKKVADYYRIIKKPIDMQTIRDNLRNKKYLSREAFLADAGQIVRNSELYNGAKSVLTQAAQRMLDLCLQRLAEKEDKLMRLEKAINPLLDDNDLVAFSYILGNIIDTKLKTIENSYVFHNPVNKKAIKDYYEIIKNPMDLSSLSKNVKAFKYHSREEFLNDVDLIFLNSSQYNGKDSAFTKTASVISQVAKDNILDDEALIALEENIKATQEAAMDAADSESVVTSLTGGNQDADNLSVDDMSMTRENITIAEDELTMNSANNETQDSYMQNVSRDEDFVDVEGMNDSTQEKSDPVDNSLAQDLQISPDNSDNEDANETNFDSKLSSSGSDSEHEDPRSESFNEESQSYDYNSSNPQFSYPEQYAPAETEEDGNSFDPQAFFASFGKGQSSAEYHQPTADINNDLQMSDSESENEEGHFVEVSADMVPDDDDSNFNIEEFLQQQKS